MLRSLWNGTMDVPLFLLRIPVILIALTFHEFAHGWVAYKMGDPTARNFGRLTMNPIKHLDPIGTICMLLFGFGWAKPVPVNTRNFNKPRRGMALTALAGPVSNFILCFIGVLFYHISAKLITMFGATSSLFVYNIEYYFMKFLWLFATLNVYLAIFNFLSVPPLDGSRILFVFLPDKYYFGVMKYERYIMIAILVLLYTGLLTGPLSWLAGQVLKLFDRLVGLIPFI